MMKRDRQHILFCLLLAVGCPLWATPPQVSNVRFQQNPNSNLVEITYDLSDPDGDKEFIVTFDVSTDGGSTFNLKPSRWSPEPGYNRAGYGRKITWDAYGDCGQVQSSSIVVRVKAEDGRLPAQPQTKVTEPPRTPSAPKEQPVQRTAPSGMTFLRTNDKGFEEYLWLKDSSVMVKIPAAEFWMGSPTEKGEENEHPQHRVSVSTYYIDKFELTNRQFARFVRETGYRTTAETNGILQWTYFRDSGTFCRAKACWRDYYTPNTEDHPVLLVSWDDASKYCAWSGKRLPTEAEWELAARGTDGREYPWGNGPPNGTQCNVADRSLQCGWSEKGLNDGYEVTSPVGSYPGGASPYGCMNLAGNVSEWCYDWYARDFYASSPLSNPRGPTKPCWSHVFRGGGWHSLTAGVRSALREYFEVGDMFFIRTEDSSLGFRCAR